MQRGEESGSHFVDGNHGMQSLHKVEIVLEILHELDQIQGVDGNLF